MSLRISASLLLAAGLLAACSTMDRMGSDASGTAAPTPEVDSETLPPADAPVDEASLMPTKPATKSNVVVAQYSANFKYADLASRIDRTFRSCWIGKDKDFAGYTYGGMAQDNVKYVITLNEQVDGKPLDLVKVTIVPAAGQDGFAVSLETRAEGSPGEKTMRDGIRFLASGQKVC